MANFRRVTDTYWVSPQLTPEDVAEAAALGVRTILNNRPPHEPQPDPAQIEQAAKAHGLAYVEATVLAFPSEDAVAAVPAALSASEAPVLAYCASGTRSIAAWGAAEVRAGQRTREGVLSVAREAGYDLNRWI